SNSSSNSSSNTTVQHPPMAYQQQQQQLLQQLQQQHKFQAQAQLTRGNTSRNNLATLVAAINGHENQSGGAPVVSASGYQLSPAAASRVAHAPPHSPLGPPSYSAATAQSAFSYYGQQQHQLQLNHQYQQQQQQLQQQQLQQQLPPPDLTDGIDHPSAQSATPPDSPNPGQTAGQSDLEQQLCVVAKMQKSVTITVTPQRSNSMDFLNFEEKRQLIASSLSLSDILQSSNQQQQQANKEAQVFNGGQCGK
ncbi:hypothetical protein KR067_000550, partial [Drosophila pandora]